MARVTCTTEGFTDNWIELSESWTRREVKELDGSNVGEVLAILRRKAMACNILLSDGTAITDPQRLAEDALEDCDQQVWGFILGCQFRAVAALQALGNFSVRLSSDSAGKLK